MLIREKNPAEFPITGQSNIHVNQNLTEKFKDRWIHTTITIIEVLFEIYDNAVEKTRYLLKTAAIEEVLSLNDWPAISPACV